MLKSCILLVQVNVCKQADAYGGVAIWEACALPRSHLTRRAVRHIARYGKVHIVRVTATLMLWSDPICLRQGNHHNE